MSRTARTSFAATLAAGLSLLVTAGAGSAFAQAAPAAPAPPPPLWTGNVGVGLALTSGNADTTNFNLAFKVTYDPSNPHLMTADAIYLRGSNAGEVVVNRSLANVRDEYALTQRALVFGQVRYLRDTFKDIDYLIAPTVGLGYKIVDTAPTRLAVDVGAGGVWERNTGLGTSASGAVTLGETLTHKLTGTATLTQSINGLWKTSDFGDALYTITLGLAASVTQKSTLKLELLETYKTVPPLPTIQKQDVALVTSFVYGF